MICYDLRQELSLNFYPNVSYKFTLLFAKELREFYKGTQSVLLAVSMEI